MQSALKNKQQRQKTAENIVYLMGILNPQLRNAADYKHKLWDHIFIISKFKLDVDSPYPIPTQDTARIKPAELPYPQARIKLKHYGKNVESLVKKRSACRMKRRKNSSPRSSATS